MLLTTDLYWKHDPMEVDWFLRLQTIFPRIKFFHPNQEKAPWHVQARLDNGVILNVWPHVVKAMIQDMPPAVQGAQSVEELIWEAMQIQDLGLEELIE